MPTTVTNLTCVYGAGTPFETTALRDVSVTVENGSFVGILGRTRKKSVPLPLSGWGALALCALLCAAEILL